MVLAGLIVDKHYEKAKEAMRSNLQSWGYYDDSMGLGGAIYGQPLFKFMQTREDTELLIAYLQYMLQNKIVAEYG